MKFFLGKTAVKIPFPQKGRQQVRILDQRVPQKSAVAKDHDGVMRQKIMLVEQPYNFRRLDQPLKQKQRAIRIRSVPEQPRQGRSQPGREPCQHSLQIQLGTFKVSIRWIGGRIRVGVGLRPALAGQGPAVFPRGTNPGQLIWQVRWRQDSRLGLSAYPQYRLVPKYFLTPIVL